MCVTTCAHTLLLLLLQAPLVGPLHLVLAGPSPPASEAPGLLGRPELGAVVLVVVVLSFVVVLLVAEVAVLVVRVGALRLRGLPLGGGVEPAPGLPTALSDRFRNTQKSRLMNTQQ